MEHERKSWLNEKLHIMGSEIANLEELQQELLQTLQDAETSRTNAIELYETLRRLERRYRECGMSVPKALSNLEHDLELEFQATSQGR